MARVTRRKRLVQGAKLSMQSPDARDSARGANQPKRDSYGNVILKSDDVVYFHPGGNPSNPLFSVVARKRSMAAKDARKGYL